MPYVEEFRAKLAIGHYAQKVSVKFIIGTYVQKVVAKHAIGPCAEKLPEIVFFLNGRVRYEKTLLTTYKHPQTGHFPPHCMRETFKPLLKREKTCFLPGGGGKRVNF